MAFATSIEPEGGSDLRDNDVKLLRRSPQHSSVGQRPRIYHMIDVQRGIVRTNNGAGNVAAFYVGPRPGIAVNTLVPPSQPSHGCHKAQGLRVGRGE